MWIETLDSINTSRELCRMFTLGWLLSWMVSRIPIRIITLQMPHFDPSHKFHDALDKHPSMHHLVSKCAHMCTFHDDVIKWKHFPRYWPFVRGIHGEFPSQRPVTRSFDVFFDLRLNKRLSKQWWGWWFETLSRPLWRHRNVLLQNGVLWDMGLVHCWIAAWVWVNQP